MVGMKNNVFLFRPNHISYLRQPLIAELGIQEYSVKTAAEYGLSFPTAELLGQPSPSETWRMVIERGGTGSFCKRMASSCLNLQYYSNIALKTAPLMTEQSGWKWKRVLKLRGFAEEVRPKWKSTPKIEKLFSCLSNLNKLFQVKTKQQSVDLKKRKK